MEIYRRGYGVYKVVMGYRYVYSRIRYNGYYTGEEREMI